MSPLQALVDEAEHVTAWSDRATIERIYRALADQIPDFINRAPSALLAQARATRDRLCEFLETTSPPGPRPPSLQESLPPCSCGCNVMLVKDHASISDLPIVLVACKQCRAIRLYLGEDASRLGLREITLDQVMPPIYR